MAPPESTHVFINAPFDPSYESLFVTLVGTLVFLGQEPHCVLEVREKGEGRLKRILDLIRKCRISIHELSRVGLPVRFNMPYELGLASALKLTSGYRFEIFVLETRDHRLDITLSDYKGRDPLIHHGTCDGMVACLLDTFASDIDDAPRQFRSAARLLRKSASLMKKDLKASSIYRASLFRRLVASAGEIAVDRGFIKP
jgi:hypothetical protein